MMEAEDRYMEFLRFQQMPIDAAGPQPVMDPVAPVAPDPMTSDPALYHGVGAPALGVTLPDPIDPVPGAPVPEEQGLMGEFWDYLDTVQKTVRHSPDALGLGAVRGVMEALYAADLVDDQHMERFRALWDSASDMAVEFGVNETAAGMLEGVGQIAPAALPVFKVLRGFGMARAGAAVIAEAVGGAFGVNPDEPNLGNLAQEFTSPTPGGQLEQALNLLATSPDDPDWQNRARNAIQDSLLGLAFEGLLKAPGAARAMVERFKAGKSPIPMGMSIEDVSDGGKTLSGFQDYRDIVDPSGRTIPAEDRPNLAMGDMYGMLPKDSYVVGQLDDVTLHRGQNGDYYATAYNADLGDQDVVGFIQGRENGTELAVVQEMQGRGIGSELQYLFRSENPLAPTGGLTESGASRLESTYDRLVGDNMDPLDQVNLDRSAPGSDVAPPVGIDQAEPGAIPAPAADLAAARADTRMSAEIVGERIKTIVPQEERVSGGSYTPGRPDGGRWSDIGEDALNARGDGFKGTNDDLQAIWEQSLAEVSEAGRMAVENTGATWRAFDAGKWDKALRLPARSQLWYELSGEKFAANLPGLSDDEFMTFVDLVGATSARSNPGDNLQRALAVLSQRLRGVPVDTDIMMQAAASDALRRKGVDLTSDLSNKTGAFSDTLALVAGRPVTYPISVNDVWVAQAFGISDQDLMSNQSLHEVFAKYVNKLRDQVNLSPGAIPHESWQLQARQWVEIRSSADGVDTSLAGVDGSDYAGEWAGVIQKLEAAGMDIPDGVITRDILMDDRFADALRTTVPAFRDAPKATIEFGTLLTPNGLEAARLYASAKAAGDLITQREYLGNLTSAMYHSARGSSTIWQELHRVATGRSDNVSRMYNPTKDDPFAISGTFEGAAAPNLRIPLKDMSPEEIAYFNAMAGRGLRQKAMAAVKMDRLADGVEMPEGAIPTMSVRFDLDKPVAEEMLTDFTTALGEGFEIQVMRYPDGVLFDIVPKDGHISPTVEQVDNAIQILEDAHGIQSPRLFDTAFHSKYGANFVEDAGGQKEYNQIIGDTLKGWKNGAIDQIQQLTGPGTSRASIGKYLNGSGELTIKAGLLTGGQSVSSIRGRASTIRKRYRLRLDDHARKKSDLTQLGGKIDKVMGANIPKWQRREAARSKGSANGG